MNYAGIAFVLFVVCYWLTAFAIEYLSKRKGKKRNSVLTIGDI